MYTNFYNVYSLPRINIDLEGVYNLLKDDFFRPAGTSWSYSSSTGWFENQISKPSAISDVFPFPLIADKYLKVNSSATGYEFVDISVSEPIIVDCVLTAIGWSGNTQTITVTGMTETTDGDWNASTLADNILAGQANVFCSAQGTDSLTFQCTTTPASDINIKVTIR